MPQILLSRGSIGGFVLGARLFDPKSTFLGYDLKIIIKKAELVRGSNPATVRLEI